MDGITHPRSPPGLSFSSVPGKQASETQASETQGARRVKRSRSLIGPFIYHTCQDWLGQNRQSSEDTSAFALKRHTEELHLQRGRIRREKIVLKIYRGYPQEIASTGSETERSIRPFKERVSISLISQHIQTLTNDGRRSTYTHMMKLEKYWVIIQK